MPEMVARIEAADFRTLQVDDATDEAAEWVRARLAPKRGRRPRLPRPDLDLVLQNFRLKRANLYRTCYAALLECFAPWPSKTTINLAETTLGWLPAAWLPRYHSVL